MGIPHTSKCVLELSSALSDWASTALSSPHLRKFSMADLEAELARFEAEIGNLPVAGASSDATGASMPPGPTFSHIGGPATQYGQQHQQQHPPQHQQHQHQQQYPQQHGGYHGHMGGPSHHTGSVMGPGLGMQNGGMGPGMQNIGMGQMGMGPGMNMGMAPAPSAKVGTIMGLKKSMGMSVGHGMMAPQPTTGASVAAPPMHRPMPPPAGSLSVAEIKAMEKQQKAAKEAEIGKKGGKLMQAAGKRWRDPTLDEWPENDFRIFVGDLGNEVTDDGLTKAFNKYTSFAKAKIIRDQRTKKSKGFGFVSFLDSADFAKALREMQGKYIGNRPCKLSKSSWDERAVPVRNNKNKGGGANKQQKTAH